MYLIIFTGLKFSRWKIVVITSKDVVLVDTKKYSAVLETIIDWPKYYIHTYTYLKRLFL